MIEQYGEIKYFDGKQMHKREMTDEELKKLIEIAPEGWLPNISPFDIPVTFFNESNQEMSFILRNITAIEFQKSLLILCSSFHALIKH